MVFIGRIYELVYSDRIKEKVDNKNREDSSNSQFYRKEKTWEIA